MKLPNLFKKQDELANENELDDDNNSLEDEQPEGVHIGTKIKVISALAVVGVAMSVAYWVQEPDQTVTGDVLSATNERTAEEAEAVSADTLDNLIAATEPVSGDFEVDISDFSYVPANIEVETGTTITWTNLDQVAHTVTGDDFSSSSLKAGESFSYTFDQPGTYEYYCAFHPQMIGTITVAGTAIAATDEEDTAGEEDTTTDEVAAEDTTDSVEDLSPAASDSLLGDDATAGTGDVMTMDANQFNAIDDTTVAAEVSPDELATTGPEELLYLGLAIFALYINRRKLAVAFKK